MDRTPRCRGDLFRRWSELLRSNVPIESKDVPLPCDVHSNFMSDLETFYRSRRDRIYNYLLRLCADADLAADMTQEAFLRYAARYDRNHIGIPLLYRIAKNALMDALRKKKADVPMNEQLMDERKDPEAQICMVDEFQRTLQVLQALQTEDREILALVSSDNELKYAEIGKILGISEGNARIRVHRARMRLREALK